MDMNNLSKSTIKFKLKQSLQIIQTYTWLIDAYVADFYVRDHWSKLPTAWLKSFQNLTPENLIDLLHWEENFTNSNIVWPLSIYALKSLFRWLCIKRQVKKNPVPSSYYLKDDKFKKFLFKGVKLKKNHEIQCMADLCQQSFYETQVDFIVDFGAGLGHLARLLGYGYGIRMCCLEKQHELNQQANKLDYDLELLIKNYFIKKDINFIKNYQRPVHVDLCINVNTLVPEFLQIIENALGIHYHYCDYTFGIVGLHPCGDLAAILLRLFLNCPKAKFLHLVGCCYMKLTTQGIYKAHNVRSPLIAYPLSEYLQISPKLSYLSYEAREIACHAIELYSERLFQCDYEFLKIHSYRAAAERIIVKYRPELGHSGLRNVKHAPHLDFPDYFYKAVAHLPIVQLPRIALTTPITFRDLKHWQHIVIFYTLRLCFAPLIESVILYDRMLYLMENDCEVAIKAVFDPYISPRNHITIAHKSC